MTSRMNLFIGEILDNEKGRIEEILIKKEIKEEVEDQNFHADENEEKFDSKDKNPLIISSTEMLVENCLQEKGKIEEILIKKEIKEEVEDQNFHSDENEEKFDSKDKNPLIISSSEMLVENCLQEKAECLSSGVLESGLPQSNSDALLFGISEKLNYKSRTAVKTFKCSSCQYQTARSLDFRRHLRTHTGEKPFKCSSCSYQAARMGNLRIHERTHTGEKPFKCNSCSYQSADRSHLQQHIRTHTGQKPFNCGSCPYQASRLAHLKRHMRTHTGERPFKCTSCPYEATQMQSLRRHIKTIHAAG